MAMMQLPGIADTEPHHVSERSTLADNDQYFLRAPELASVSGATTIRSVDLFAGCGGLTLGIREACRRLGLGFRSALAIDTAPDALDVFEANFGGQILNADVSSVFGGVVGTPPTPSERDIATSVGSVDFLIGGPPCQGHSDLNNHTRRLDPKNELYFSMVRAAEVLRPHHVLIENVPAAINDRAQVVQRTMRQFEELGYMVDAHVVDASLLGVAQRRRRLVVLASTRMVPSVRFAAARHATDQRSVDWAIGDLIDVAGNALLDESARSEKETRRRIDVLFDRGLHDLPDDERPDCHSLRRHSYRSVYGRLHADEPAPTITTGFYSMCMGRYVHPTQRRTLTAHEAARIQFFPDSFDFSSVKKRTALATMIGNAVPSALSRAMACELLQ